MTTCSCKRWLIVAGSLLAGLIAPGVFAQGCSPGFLGAEDLRLFPGGGFALAAADFNDDGRLDLATSGSSVLLANGDGTFFEAAGNAAGEIPGALAAADFDGDGGLDLAAWFIDSSTGLGRISVFPGNRDGSFRPEQVALVDIRLSLPNGLVAADLDGDGRVDLAAADGISHDVAVLLGHDDASFEPAVRFPVGSQPGAIAAADLDGDGIADLVTANQLTNDVSVLLGIGDGTFGSEVRFATGLYPFACTVADLDGDGSADIVTANLSSDFSVLLGSGDGAFQDERRLAVENAGRLQNLAAADFNGDGRMDLATTSIHGCGDRFSPCSASVRILLGTDGGMFQGPLTSSVPTGPNGLTAADFNADGQVDLAAAIFYGRSIGTVVLLNNGGVADRTPPVLFCPDYVGGDFVGPLIVNCSGPDGALVDFRAAAEDNCDLSPEVTYDHEPGTLFPLGTTLVTCTARDASGNQGQCSFEVIVTCSGRRLPGDSNQDGGVDISDAVSLLGYLFLGMPGQLPCGDGSSAHPSNRELLDWNVSAAIDLSDAVGLLNWLFQGGPPHALGEECRVIEGCPEACSAGGR